MCVTFPVPVFLFCDFFHDYGSTELRCDATTPMNGFVSELSVAMGDYTTYSCNSGYYLIDETGNRSLDGSVICHETGEFSSVFLCQGMMVNVTSFKI